MKFSMCLVMKGHSHSNSDLDKTNIDIINQESID